MKQLEKALKNLLVWANHPSGKLLKEALKEDPSPEVCLAILDKLNIFYADVVAERELRLASVDKSKRVLETISAILIGYKEGYIPPHLYRGKSKK